MKTNKIKSTSNNEKSNRHNIYEIMLLKSEIVIGWIACLQLFSTIAIASFVPMQDWIRILLIVVGVAIFMPCVFFAVELEQITGYYKCWNFEHKYIPKYTAVLMAPHIGRTRWLRCPKCNKKSWSKKVMSK